MFVSLGQCQTVAATTNSEYCYMVLLDITRIFACTVFAGNRFRRAIFWVGKRHRLASCSHTHTRGQPEHSDIDFSTLPAVGDSSLGHASRHVPIRTALEGVGLGV
jgi:hypothetical protein